MEKEGFTLIEIGIVFAIFALIAGLGLPLGIDAYRNYLLTSETRNIISILRRAENLAFSNSYNSAYGISFQPDRFVIFQGESYATRNSIFDENYLKTTGITASSTPEIIFSPLSGLPNSSTTIILSNGIRSQAVSINSQGVIDW